MSAEFCFCSRVSISDVLRAVGADVVDHAAPGRDDEAAALDRLDAVGAAFHALGQHLELLVGLDLVERAAVEQVEVGAVGEQAVRPLEPFEERRHGRALDLVHLLRLRVGDVDRALGVHGHVVEPRGARDRDARGDRALGDVDADDVAQVGDPQRALRQGHALRRVQPLDPLGGDDLAVEAELADRAGAVLAPRLAVDVRDVEDLAGLVEVDRLGNLEAGVRFPLLDELGLGGGARGDAERAGDGRGEKESLVHGGEYRQNPRIPQAPGPCV